MSVWWALSANAEQHSNNRGTMTQMVREDEDLRCTIVDALDKRARGVRECAAIRSAGPGEAW